jgi:hypothetical protein
MPLSRLRTGHGAANMAVVRHFALNLVRQAKDKRAIKRRTWTRCPAPLTFKDDADADPNRLADPVAPARRSQAALNPNPLKRKGHCHQASASFGLATRGATVGHARKT